MLSVQVIFKRPKFIEDVFFPFRLTVSQPFLDAVILHHSMLSRTHKRERRVYGKYVERRECWVVLRQPRLV